MDFGVGFITKNIMLPVLDFFFQFCHSYGLSIVLLTLVVRFALWPLGANSIRSMRKMQAVQPLMTKRMEELKTKHGDNNQELQQEQMAMYKELGVNPLGGCLPLLVQMPVFFALFATLRGTPFSDQQYPLKIDVAPATEQVQFKGKTDTHNIYLDPKLHVPVFITPSEVRLPVGQSFTFQPLKESDNQPFTDQPGGRPIYWRVLSGAEHVTLEGNKFTAKTEGSVSVAAEIPGLAADKGFLFIQALGRAGVAGPNGIYWDNSFMIFLFGLSIFASQALAAKNNPAMTDQQKQIGKFVPVMVVASTTFFPLPAGVLIYMVLSNCFQVLQTIILYREPLPEAIQKLQEELAEVPKAALPFERKQRRKRKK
jgi:YidC/Oxa1 family membrane protein insertase